MTNEEIKKALECCSNPSISYCKDCPYANYGEFDCCNGKMCKDALNLITEQEKEIERLKAECALLDDELRIARQNTIDVLNKLKEKMFEREYMGVKYRERIFYESDIDEVIKEQLQK